MGTRGDPMWRELGVAVLAMSCLAGLIAGLYWVFTGHSPWPFVVLGEVAGFGFGVSLLAITSPRRRS